MKLLFDDENMCRGRPKIALPASRDQNVYYCLETQIIFYYGLDTKIFCVGV
jgi:hypothetical protein